MKKVTVLMSTYNGEKYLDEQIESLISQEGVMVTILVRDDGSDDNTISKLRKWEHEGILSWYDGENLKPAHSFMNLIKNAPKSDFYAFCDQDDVWDKDKLACAVKIMERYGEDEVALYFSRARLVDENLNFMRLSEEDPSCTLGGVLIGSHAIGCTMVLNSKLIALLQQYTLKCNILHDAWTIRVCLAVGGKIYYDLNPHIQYRQHSNNVVGVSKTSFNRYRRMIRNSLLIKRLKSQVAHELLDGYGDLMPIENKELLSQVSNYRNSFSNKLKLVKNKHIRRTKNSDNLILGIAIMLGIF